MLRLTLPKINFLFYVAIYAFVLSIQTTIFGSFPLSFIQPDIVLLMAVYFGFRRGLYEGGLLVALFALGAEAHSSSGEYFFFTLYLYAFVIAKMLSRSVLVPDMASSMGIVATLALFKRLGVILLLGTYGQSSGVWWSFLTHVVPSVLAQTALTPLLFSWFTRLDMRTWKDQHADDEYDLNREF